MKQIEIFDTTLRDGEQIPGAKLNKKDKITIAGELEKLGVDVIEAGFPASSPQDAEAVAEIARMVKNCSVTGLARAVRRDIDILWEAVKHARQPRIHIVLASSDVHVRDKHRAGYDTILQMGVDAVKYAKKYTHEVEYSTEDAPRSNLDYLCRVIEAVIKAGATVINIPDTVGYAVPEEFGALIKKIREKVPATDRVKMSVHCHNDLGMATVNTLAAVKMGIDQVEVTVNGLGERAGNASLEEVVMALETRADYYQATTGINCSRILPASQMVSSLMNIPVQPNKAIVGSNAFAHSSGIHQDGILKARETYEIFSPGKIGAPEHSIILTARSGRHALKHRLELLGFHFSQPVFEKLHKEFLKMADSKKEIDNSDLSLLVAQIEEKKQQSL